MQLLHSARVVVRFLIIVYLGLLLNRLKKDEVVENLLSPSDCQGNTVWSEVDKTCACNWGWTGNDCDIWGKFFILWNFSNFK